LRKKIYKIDEKKHWFTKEVETGIKMATKTDAGMVK